MRQRPLGEAVVTTKMVACGQYRQVVKARNLPEVLDIADTILVPVADIERVRLCRGVAASGWIAKPIGRRAADICSGCEDRPLAA